MKTTTKNKGGAITVMPATTQQPPATVTNAAQQVVAIIEKVISNPDLDVQKMQAILEMQKDAMRFQAEIEYNRAMRDCQQKIKPIKANCENNHTHSKYANLEAIDTVIRPIYTKFGFSLSFDTRPFDKEHMEVICYVMHIAGHTKAFKLVGELDSGGFKGSANKTGIQAAGSSAAYLQRYLTKLAFNVVILGEDKDGNKTVSKQRPADAFHEGVQGESDEAQKLTRDTEQLTRNLEKLLKKTARTNLLNNNMPLIQRLAKAGHENKIQELHALVDQGE